MSAPGSQTQVSWRFEDVGFRQPGGVEIHHCIRTGVVLLGDHPVGTVPVAQAAALRRVLFRQEHRQAGKGRDFRGPASGKPVEHVEDVGHLVRKGSSRPLPAPHPGVEVDVVGNHVPHLDHANRADDSLLDELVGLDPGRLEAACEAHDHGVVGPALLPVDRQGVFEGVGEGFVHVDPLARPQRLDRRVPVDVLGSVDHDQADFGVRDQALVVIVESHVGDAPALPVHPGDRLPRFLHADGGAVVERPHLQVDLVPKPRHADGQLVAPPAGADQSHADLAHAEVFPLSALILALLPGGDQVVPAQLPGQDHVLDQVVGEQIDRPDQEDCSNMFFFFVDVLVQRIAGAGSCIDGPG